MKQIILHTTENLTNKFELIHKMIARKSNESGSKTELKAGSLFNTEEKNYLRSMQHNMIT